MLRSELEPLGFKVDWIDMKAAGRAGHIVARHMVSGRFVTACYLRLDCRRHLLTCANAGHNPPLVVRASGEVVRLAAGGTVLGVFPDAVYEERNVELGPGDRLVLYTDGITEATAPDGDEYGEDRLAAAIDRHAGVLAPELTSALFNDVLTFSRGSLNDDATIVSVVVQARSC